MHSVTLPASRRIVIAALAAFALFTAGCGKSPEEVKAAQAAELARTTGAVLVKTNLAQAVIKAVPEGSTSAYEGPTNQPLMNLPAGRYTVTASLDAWPSRSGEATVQAGQTTELVLNFPTGSLRVDSTPSGAAVKLGTGTLGKTPLTLAQVPVGDHSLTLEYPSWPPVTAKVTVAENTEAVANVRLPHGRVFLDSLPSGATVLQGRNTLGKTPLTLERVPAGVRKFTLQLKDFPTVEVSVTVHDDKETRFHPALGALFPALDPAELLRAVWIPDDPGKITTGFNSTTGIYKPRNDVVKNIHRERLYNGWLRKAYRLTGQVKTHDAATGSIELNEQKSELARYRVLAQLRPGTSPTTPLAKNANVTFYGRLTAVEEPVWPFRVITLEISDAELLPDENTSREAAKDAK